MNLIPWYSDRGMKGWKIRVNPNKPLGLTPSMGWNSWNTFTWDINEQLVRDVADLFISEGYKDAGYEYIVIDDCWSLKERDENGNLKADPMEIKSSKFLPVLSNFLTLWTRSNVKSPLFQ